jgi:hypothetical protein
MCGLLAIDFGRGAQWMGLAGGGFSKNDLGRIFVDMVI